MIDLITWIIALPVAVALAVFSIELLLGLWRGRRRVLPNSEPTTLLLMPAHNEAATIGNVLKRLAPLLSERVSLLVIADNCTDATADIARAAGAKVVERTEPYVRGKGHALAFGRAALENSPPDCVIVFDADCESDPSSIADLAAFCVAENRAVQARYLLHPDKQAPANVQISNFAFWVKNALRQRGQRRLGGAAILTGTGMAFPWALFEGLPLATSDIVEDLALGVHLIRIGKAPAYLEQAVIWSVAAGEQATLKQRSRWEHGFVTTAMRHGLPSILKGLFGLNWKLFLLGLHLLVPPLALLLLVSILMVALLLILSLFAGPSPALLTLSSTLAVAGLAVLLSWVVGGHRWLGPRALLAAPSYVLWKVPVYFNLILRRTPGWERTDRISEDKP
jgi:cellulose synthase/poly-beta-1,6-N-acetylglucosamine synthase-like glycosyltransferase